MTATADDKAILGILKRQEEQGGHISEGEMAREIGSDAESVSTTLHRLQSEGSVTRTGTGNWELTPAASMRTTALPDPDEPRPA